MFKDYYQILEVDYPSTTEEIKNAFRKQAMRWHPDRNPGDDTTARMQDIVEAYAVLKDEESRRLYNHDYELFFKIGTGAQKNTSANHSYAGYEYSNSQVRNHVENARRRASDRNYWDELLQGLKKDASTMITGAWDEMKYYVATAIILSIIGLLILLCSN